MDKQLKERGKLDPKVMLNNGTSMPQIVFGMYKIDSESCEQTVLEALKAGYRHFDTASFYGNEAALGRALNKSGIPRDELYITTKVWNDAQKQGPAAVRKSFEKSLAALDCGYLDLFLVHWPVPGHHVETYKEMEKLHRQGKVQSIGLSNYSEADYKELVDAGITVMPTVNQIEVSPAVYRADMIEFFTDKAIIISAYKALHRGASLDKTPIADIAKKHSVTSAQVMLRWGLQHGLAVVAKTSSPDRMRENRSILTFTLDDEDMALLDGMTTKEDIAVCSALEEKSKRSL
mmetsp:Transcript_18970/g.41330  ORF Transcript_18970/g.41330 Transcript_18970/m.41330 type:complete len:290 (-) Transcript_18970:1075-1944(-)